MKEGRLLTGYEENFIREKCVRAGLVPADYMIGTIGDLARMDAHVVVTLGEQPLQILTGKKSIWKWHLSPLDDMDKKKVIPTFDFAQMWKDWSLTLYFELAIRRAAKFATPGPWVRKEERYVLGPDVDNAIAILEALPGMSPEWLSIDIETGRNQINTFGVAWSGSDAVAVKTLPDGIPPVAFKKLWDCIRTLCENDIPKVMQNGIYERTYLSRYGIHMHGFKHDTMTAMKFLWPELEKGLDNVGRLYTTEPYWKDDGRVAGEEGKRKDWGDIRDWDRHFTYNCRDTTNTLIAMHAQRLDLQQRGMLELYDGYLVRLFDCVEEMGVRGLPLDTTVQAALIAEYETRSKDLTSKLSSPINPRSWRHKAKLLKDKGYELPKKKKRNKAGDTTMGETTDELALKQLRLKYPGDDDLRILLEISGIEKALSSYLRVETLEDKRIRFMLDACGTETGRMSCSLDPWRGGFNAQTLSAYAKKMIAWPEVEGAS